MCSPPREWKFRLRHMLDAIDRILKYTDGKSKRELGDDSMAMDAVVWNLSVLGEAARHIPEYVAERYPLVPWPEMRGIRNRIVHGYDQIDIEIVWAVIQHELPSLRDELSRMDDAEGSA